MNPIVVRGEVSERDLADVRVGTPATVNFASGASIEGRVRYVRHQASPQTRTFQVEVEIPNRGGDVPGRDERRDRAARRPDRRRRRAALGGDDCRQRRARGAGGRRGRHAWPSSRSTVDRRHARRTGAHGVPAGARVIVSGQDLVADGETVRPGRHRSTARGRPRGRGRRHGRRAVMDIVGIAIRNARLTHLADAVPDARRARSPTARSRRRPSPTSRSRSSTSA